MRRIMLIVTTFLLWLLLTWNLDPESLMIGAGICILIVILFGHYFRGSNFKYLNPVRWFWFLIYIPVFIWEMTKANFDVAYRVLHPKLPIDPGIIRVKTSIQSAMGKTFLANSITLTPGTFTVDIKDEILYVHCIKVPAESLDEATEIIVKRFEPLLKKIFD